MPFNKKFHFVLKINELNWLYNFILLRIFLIKVKENESNDDIKEAFRVFDRDGDGFISAEELGQVRLKDILINEFHQRNLIPCLI